VSGSAAKAARRDLRRAAGTEAVDALEACIKVIDNRILPNIAALQKIADDHESQLIVLAARADLASSSYARHEATLTAFRGMPLRERLRWLIMGR
jgi:hypothetical protein